MNRDMFNLYQGLLTQAQEFRVSIFKLSRIRKNMESGNGNFCKSVPSLIREIEIQIKRNVKDEQKKREALISLDRSRDQFLALKEDGAYRKGKRACSR